MTRQHKLSALIGYSIALVGVVVVAILVFAPPSQGAGLCRVQRVQRVVTAVAPVYAQAYYQVGAQLQQQAVDTQGFRQSPEYLELLQLRGFQAGVAAVQQQRVETTTAPPPVSTPEDFPRPQAPPNETLPPPPAAPGSPEWEAFKVRYPTIAHNCAGCHGQKDVNAPAGDLYLNGGMALDGPENTWRRDSIVRMLWLGKMPKNKPADDQMISAILDELYPVEPEPAPAPPGPST